jgi:hypothetical protein
MALTRSFRSLALCLWIAGGFGFPAHGLAVPGEGASGGEQMAFDLLDNGDFAEAYTGKDNVRRALIPWWRLKGDVRRTEEEGGTWAVTTGDGSLSQPVAAFAKSVAGITIGGRVRGQGRLVVTDGAGGRVVFDVAGDEPNGSPFEVSGAQLTSAFGREIVPRLEVVLASGTGRPVAWTDLRCRVPLPLPTETALARELVTVLDGIFSLWIERGVRAGGSGFLTRVFDVDTGETLYAIPGGLSPLHSALLDAVAVLGDEAPEPWTEALDAFLVDYFARCLHPDTGLPRRVDPETGAPIEGQHIEAAADLGFLLDVFEGGPARHRAAAQDAALRMGETILACGVLPDGTVAPKYRAADSDISTATPPLRRLDVPAQLARLGAMTGDERFFNAARNALAEIEFTHFWTGEWHDLDPGFDDDFGHYGARSAVMFAARPDEPAFGALADSGLTHYAPRWRNALRFGATMAADQVRCWELLAAHARERPETLPLLRDLFPPAVASHFKAQQRGGGAWEDLTYVHFNPKANLQVGDLGGVPSNLLFGLAVVYEDRFGMRTNETRARFAAVLHTTLRHYRRPYGLFYGRDQPGGPNPAGGGIRIAAALVRMLENLRR